MTPRQQQVFLFIAKRIESRRMSPTYIEIADGLSLNAFSTVHKHCRALRKEGLLGIRPKEARGLFLTGQGKAELSRLSERPRLEIEANPTLEKITMKGGNFELKRVEKSVWILEIVPHAGRPLWLSLAGDGNAAVVPVLHEAGEICNGP